MLHLHHTKYFIMHNHGISQEIVSYFYVLKLFSTFTHYMSVRHGYSTIGGIEYGGCGEDKKVESLTSTRPVNRLWRCPSIDVNVRSRDCHATDALEP